MELDDQAVQCRRLRVWGTVPFTLIPTLERAPGWIRVTRDRLVGSHTWLTVEMRRDAARPKDVLGSFGFMIARTIQMPALRCKYGHEMVGNNVARDGRRRRCRLCMEAKGRAQYAKPWP